LLNNQVSRSEKLWLLKFVLLVLLLTSVPYWIGYTSAGTGWRFTGFIFGVEDGNSYIAKMLSGASGNWLFRTPYTAAEQNGFLAFLPYLLLGKLTSSPGQHEQLVVLFHMFRGVGGLLLVLATYDFIALFIEQPAGERLLWLLWFWAVVSGGCSSCFWSGGKSTTIGILLTRDVWFPGTVWNSTPGSGACPVIVGVPIVFAAAIRKCSGEQCS
jgi:hypothetical protein